MLERRAGESVMCGVCVCVCVCGAAKLEPTRRAPIENYVLGWVIEPFVRASRMKLEALSTRLASSSRRACGRASFTAELFTACAVRKINLGDDSGGDAVGVHDPHS